MDENIAEWKSIGKGADICTNDPYILEVIDSKEEYNLYYEDLKPLVFEGTIINGLNAEPSPEITQAYKNESKKYSYILVQYFDDSFTLINDVLLRFKLPEEVSDGK